MGKSIVIKGADFSNVAINTSEHIAGTMGIIPDSGGSVVESNYRGYIKFTGTVGDSITIKAPQGFSFSGWNTNTSWALVGEKAIQSWVTEASVILTTGYFVINISYGNHTSSDTFTQEMLDSNPFELIEY